MGRHVNAACRACDGLGQNKIVRVGKNSGPVLSHLWTKVHEILGQRKKPFVLSNAFARLSMSRFVEQIFAIKSRSRRKQNKCKRCLAPTFSGGKTPSFLAPITVHRLANFGWIPFDSWCPSAKSGNEVECRIYGGWVKTHLQFEAVCRPKFMWFWDDVGDSL